MILWNWAFLKCLGASAVLEIELCYFRQQKMNLKILSDPWVMQSMMVHSTDSAVIFATNIMAFAGIILMHEF